MAWSDCSVCINFFNKETLVLSDRNYATTYFRIALEKRLVNQSENLPELDQQWWPTIPLTDWHVKGILYGCFSFTMDGN